MKRFGQKLKDTFLPHEGNNHKPLLFCEAGIATLVAIAVIFFGVAVVGKMTFNRSILPASVESLVLVDLANKDRTENNVKPLAINDTLVRAAQMKADDMAKNGYFAHTSPAGVTPWYWFRQAGYTFLYAGENLAVDFNQSVDVNSAWMNSPLHRQNILNGNFTEVGIAIAQGEYKGEATTFVVQMFGSPIQNVAAVIQNPETLVAEAQTPIVSENVAGESTNIKDKFTPLYTSEDFVAVKNDDAIAPSEPVLSTETSSPTEQVAGEEAVSPEAPVYSTGFQRLLASPSNAIGIFFIVLFAIVFCSLLLMIFIEIRKQHKKSILYGVLILILLLSFAYLTKETLFSSVTVI